MTSVIKKTCSSKNIIFLAHKLLNQIGVQPHLAQCYSRRIALMLNGIHIHESKIYFEVQLGVNCVEMFC